MGIKNREALRNLLDEIIMNLTMKIPFTQFRSRVALNIKHAVNMWYQNHFAAFLPSCIDTMYEVMTRRLAAILNTRVPYGESDNDSTPFSIAVDND